ncbi:hypothetical protein [Actibacterium pelagium]|uniref:Uncharacterized protein n=1 Tax=Actibacterium pelagium TaxID=2029103 RepID=A0A917ABF0_9RHOB|nr:hypothetical protein [Actibacterium pelagium]GGE38958.1 hypothetical protein GCM10011517_03400 [Actibacterium pelagium]
MKLDTLFSVSVLLTAIPYFAGYIYNFAFFGYYHIYLAEVSIPQNEIYSGAFFVVKTLGEMFRGFVLENLVAFIVLPVFLLTTCVALGLNPLRLVKWESFRLGESSIVLVSVAFLATIILVFLGAHMAGSSVAEERVNRLLPVMVVPQKSDTAFRKTSSAAAEQLLNFHSDALIYMDDKTAFILRRPIKGDPWVIRVPKEDAQLIFTNGKLGSVR